MEMKETDYKIAKELKRRLSSEFNLIDFKVFGSRALGTSTDDSDMDVYVQVETVNSDTKKKIFEIAWEVDYKEFSEIFIDEAQKTVDKATGLFEKISVYIIDD